MHVGQCISCSGPIVKLQRHHVVVLYKYMYMMYMCVVLYCTYTCTCAIKLKGQLEPNVYYSVEVLVISSLAPSPPSAPSNIVLPSIIEPHVVTMYMCVHVQANMPVHWATVISCDLM